MGTQGAGVPQGEGSTWAADVDSDLPQAGVKRSWADVLGQGLPLRNDRNVLEVVLEKDFRGPFIVTEIECFNLMKKLGLDPRPGVHVLGVQICPQVRGIIYFTLKEDIDIAKFCSYEVLEVTSSGIRVVNLKPAGKREVVITLRGIHPNTKDDIVVNYLNRFGKVISKKIVYGAYSEGPLKGFKNGDRSLKVELRPGLNIGSYHVLDGQKVSLKYLGQ